MRVNCHQQIFLLLWVLAGVQVALAQNCTSTGLIAVTDTCNQYYLCVAIGTSFIQLKFTCPGSSVFDTATSLCTTSITCSTSRDLSTFAYTTAATCNDAGFICANSTSFILCVNGVASGDAQTCTTGTSCSSDCSLNCSATTPCSNSSSTTTTTTNNTNTTVSTTILSSITIQEGFSCSSTGYFGVSRDCSLYYLCVFDPTSGTYTQVLYTCPGSSLFNTATSLCTTGTATCA